MAYKIRRFNAAEGLSNNLYPDLESTQFLVLTPISLRSILICFSLLRLGLSIGLFPVGLSVKNGKTLLPSFILDICPSSLNLLDLIIVTI